jgi:hypothetical protein
MNKTLPLFVVVILILSGIGTIAKNVENNVMEKENIKKSLEADISELKIIERNDNYIELNLGDEELYLMNPGQPMIPRILHKYELPFGATNINVEVKAFEIEEQKITKQIRPAPSPLPLSPNADCLVKGGKDKTVYGSNEMYPHSWYSFHSGCGLNKYGEHVTHLTVNIFPIRYSPLSGKITIAENFDIEVTYEEPKINIFPDKSTYDLVIIGPPKFSIDINRLVEHKNSYGVETIFKPTNEIYDENYGCDKAEKIKYFLKDAVETWGISHVLLFGGLKSIIYANPKDDINHGAKWWHVPVRYSNFQWDGGPGYNFTSGEPGYISDLYYADIYKDGGEFEDWDSNGNGVFGEWSGDHRDEIDLYPDITFGRLACRNNKEAKNVVDKIIKYEEHPADPSWFNRVIAISGDGFLDQEDWNILWDTSEVSDGTYVIHAQSTNPDEEKGPIDKIQITLDKTVETNITFNHDDHLFEELQDGYPAPPIAEILTISNGNILGNTDYTYTPHGGEAYCNDLYWYANISYIDEVLTIRGKGYDPKPYGNVTDIDVWIENIVGTEVFRTKLEDTETYYEGEWIVGDEILRGRGGGLVYMSEDFEKYSVFTSNGKWVEQADVIEEFSEGYGLAFFSGHGSPGWWGNHYPGIPGNRRHGQVAGLVVSRISPFFPYFHFPLFPMKRLTNTDKLPVVSVGGCHNSMFSVSLIPSVMNLFVNNWMFTYGTPTPECWSWYLVKLPNTGAIATMGNTGYGWGSEGDVCTIGTGDGWINTEFFKQYGEEDLHILGMAYTQAITSYITHHKTFELEYWRHDYGWDGIDQKTVEQWQLLGDPSLQIGGYP